MEHTRVPKCSNCGGRAYDNGICLFCNCKNDVLDEIMKLITPSKTIDEYYETIILKKIENNTILSEEEDKILYLLLKYDMVNESSLRDGKIIINILNKNNIISYDTFEFLIIRSTQYAMKKINNERIKPYFPKVYISELDGAGGNTFSYEYISFDKKSIENLYKGNFETLSIYFHELRHIEQEIEIYLKNFSSDIIDMIKDKVIKDYEFKKYGTKRYYEINYFNISFEVDAHHNGIDMTKALLHKYQFDYLVPFAEVLRNAWPVNSNRLERMVEENGVMVTKTLDEVFDGVIADNPHYLEKYPQLAIEYIKEDNKVRKKTKEELVDMLISGTYSEVVNSYIKDLLKAIVFEEKRK